MEIQLENRKQLLPQNNLERIIPPKSDKDIISKLELGSQLLNEADNETNNLGVQKSSIKGVRNQIIVTFATLLGAAAAGMVNGYSAVILPQLYNSTEPLAIDIAMGSWIASVFSIASPFGSFTSGPMTDYFGRKPVLILSFVPLIAGWLFIAMAQSHLMIILGRIISGFALGLHIAPAKVLVTECIEPNLRGILTGAPFAGYSIGVLIVYAMGPFMHWRTVAWYGIVLPVICFIYICCIYESPVWLARKNKWDEAKKALTWLRGGQKNAKVEFDQLKIRVQNEKELNELNNCKTNKSFFVVIKKRSVLKPMIIIFGFNLLQTISGNKVFVFYAVDIIRDFGANLDARQSAILSALDRLLFTFVFCYLLYKISRRSTFIISSAIGGISCFVLSAYLVIRRGEPKSAIDFYVATGCVVVYISANTGIMVLFSVVIELLPANIRGCYGGFVFAFANLCLFCFAKLFPYIQPDLGSIGTFLLFGLGSFGTALIMYLMLPETQNKTLHEIEDYFDGDNWLWAKRDKKRHA